MCPFNLPSSAHLPDSISQLWRASVQSSGWTSSATGQHISGALCPFPQRTPNRDCRSPRFPQPAPPCWARAEPVTSCSAAWTRTPLCLSSWFLTSTGKPALYARPVALTLCSCLGKLLKHTVQHRFTACLEDLYPHTMLSFHAHLPTQDMLLQLKEHLTTPRN